MTNRVPASDIERIVGVIRHPTLHLARAVASEEMVYVLHSRVCLDSHPDLRQCPYSLALDNGIRPEEWQPDKPCAVRIIGALDQARLVPIDCCNGAGCPECCGRCNQDSHRCPGCGQALPHGWDVCMRCRHGR